MPDLILIANGSPDPRHRDGIECLVDAVRDRVRPGRAVGACYLDHHGPSPSELARELGRSAIAVPVVLNSAPADVSSAVRDLATGGADVQVSPPLGPDGRLVDACEELLAAAGVVPDPDTAVLLVVDHAEDRLAVAAVGEATTSGARAGWGPWGVAALSGGEPVEAVALRLREAAGRVVAVPVLIADCAARDRMALRCDDAGVPMVAGCLSQTGALADLVVARAAQDARLSA